MLRVFRDFRRLPDVLERLVHVLGELAQTQTEAGPAAERLDALELSRFHFEAECAGKLLQAEGKLKAASNAEARERQLKRSYERQQDDVDPSAAVGEEGPVDPPVLPIDAATIEAERLHALRLDLAPNSKTHALRAKWQ